MRCLKCCRVLVLLIMTAGLAGCVTETQPVKPLAETALVVSRAGDRATLEFDTEPGLIYQVLYAAQRRAGTQWMVLPGAENIVGTGMRMQMIDRVPYGQDRYYRIRIKAVVR